jgi:hypothetical protein
MLQEEEFHRVFLTETLLTLKRANGTLQREYRWSLDEAEASLDSVAALTRLLATGTIPVEALTARKMFLETIERTLEGG